MQSSFKCSAAVLALLAGQALAADPAPGWGVTGNVTAVSDYVFRGITQTQGQGTVQATVDMAHTNGFYLGAFTSGVSWAAYNNGKYLEVDLYGGYKWPIADGNVDVGLVTYWFPGAKYTIGSRTIKYNTQEWKAGINYGAFNAYGWVSTSSHWFGFAFDPGSGAFSKSSGTTYFEVNWNPEIMPGTVLNLHAGHQSLRNFSGYNFNDVKIGLTHTAGAWVLSAAGTYNDGKSARGATPYWRFFNSDGSYEYVAGSRFLVTAAYTF
jgi:uncharacterized protein (TIGR02001 family)